MNLCKNISTKCSHLVALENTFDILNTQIISIIFCPHTVLVSHASMYIKQLWFQCRKCSKYIKIAQ